MNESTSESATVIWVGGRNPYVVADLPSSDIEDESGAIKDDGARLTMIREGRTECLLIPWNQLKQMSDDFAALYNEYGLRHWIGKKVRLDPDQPYGSAFCYPGVVVEVDRGKPGNLRVEQDRGNGLSQQVSFPAVHLILEGERA